jgi:WD40 repeat protein
MPDTIRYHVFLSHSSADKPAVEEIARRLKHDGIEPWLDKWNLVPGDAWQPACEEALRGCDTCAVFIGPGGLGAWHHEELRAAIDRRVTETVASPAGASKRFRVIPVLLPAAKPPELGGLPAFLSATTWVEFRKSLDDEAAIHRLVCGIRGVAPGADPERAPLAGECPYRGLESFDAVHARFFFGRERLTQELVFKLRPSASGEENRFLAVLGASGSGKSSLAKAGLIPAINRGELDGSAQWPVVVFKPEHDPLESLAVALAGLDGAKPSAVAMQALLAALRAEENTLHLSTRLTLRDAPASRRVVLLIDQFEEVFTRCDDASKRKALFENLIYAATITGGRTVVLLAMRADFYGKCGPYPALAAAMSEHQLLVGPMAEDELRSAIERPAALAGGEFEPGLVEMLLQDVSGRPGSLPLLQFALTELWQRRDGRRLTVAAYKSVGGLEGALKNRADQVLASFNDAQRELCRRIFLSLTQPGEGTEDTKRRASFGELVSAGSDPADVESVVGRLADARLVTTASDPAAPGKNSVEVAHEALIRSWGQLRQWVDADRAGLRTRRRLTETAREWEHHGRDPDLLFTGARLATAREWSESHPGELSPAEVEFLAAGISAEQRKKDDEIERARRLAEDQAERAREAVERARERARNQRRIIAGLTAGLVVAVLLSGVAWRGWERARNGTTRARLAEAHAKEQAKHADALRLAAQTMIRQGDQFDLALLLSVEAHRIESNYETRTTLLSTLNSSPHLDRFQRGHSGPVSSVAFSPDGATLASASLDQTVILWDVKTGKPRCEPLRGHEDFVSGVAFSPDGATLASASDDQTIVLWDVKAGKPRGKPLRGHTSGVTRLAFSPDGATLASASDDQTVVLWDVNAEKPRGETLRGHNESVSFVAFSPDGETLASASADRTVILWDVKAGIPRGMPLRGHEDFVSGLAFSPDGETLASASDDQTLILWDVKAGKTRGKPLRRHTDVVSGVAFSPDGATLASASMDKTVILWDVEAGKPREEPLRGHTEPVTAVAFSPDGATLASASGDQTVILWDVRERKTRGVPLLGHTAMLTAVAFSLDGAILASASWDQTVILWDVKAGKTRGEPLEGHTQKVTGVASSPDGETLASASADQTVILWDVQTRKSRGEPLRGHKEAVLGVAFSPDGETLASASVDRTAILWDVKAGKPRGEPLRGHKAPVYGVAFSPDGETLASASADQTVILWDIRAGKPRGEPLRANKAPVFGVAFSPDGEMLASSSGDGTVILWDVKARKPRGEPLCGHKEAVLGVAFSPDGEMLASASMDRTVILWDVKAGKPREEPLRGHTEPVTAVAFSPSGATLASASYDTSVRLWDVKLLSSESRAAHMAGRNISLAEWNQYIGPDTPYHRTSPEYPPGNSVPEPSPSAKERSP